MIQILYFSGTGNTEYISRLIERALQSKGIHVKRDSIESYQLNANEYDTLVFGFPVYACDVPDFIKKYIEEMPSGNGKGVYFFTTKGFFSGTVLLEAEKLFFSKGYFMKGFLDIVMPGSDGLAFLKKDSKTVQKITLKDFEHMPKVTEFAQTIADQTDHAEDMIFRSKDRFFSNALRRVYPLFEKPLRKKFKADEHCILCGICEKICPAYNITVSTHVAFSDHCYLCMRCVHQCPKEAIQIGKWTKGKFRWHGPKGDYRQYIQEKTR